MFTTTGMSFGPGTRFQTRSMSGVESMNRVLDTARLLRMGRRFYHAANGWRIPPAVQQGTDEGWPHSVAVDRQQDGDGPGQGQHGLGERRQRHVLQRELK